MLAEIVDENKTDKTLLELTITNMNYLVIWKLGYIFDICMTFLLDLSLNSFDFDIHARTHTNGRIFYSKFVILQKKIHNITL